MNGCCTLTPFGNSLENPSCFPLQDICFLRTECSESGHCYSYILLLLYTTCYYTVYYFPHSCPIHGTTSASSFYVGGFALQVSVALFVHSYFVPAQPGQEQNRVPETVKCLTVANKTALATVVFPIIGGRGEVEKFISCAYEN